MIPDKASGRCKAALSQGTANLQSTATIIMITMIIMIDDDRGRGNNATIIMITMITMIDDDCGNNATMIMI